MPTTRQKCGNQTETQLAGNSDDNMSAAEPTMLEPLLPILDRDLDLDLEAPPQTARRSS